MVRNYCPPIDMVARKETQETPTFTKKKKGEGTWGTCLSRKSHIHQDMQENNTISAILYHHIAV